MSLDIYFSPFVGSCCAKQGSGVNFGWKCGSLSQCTMSGEEAGPSSPKTSFGKPVLLQGKPENEVTLGL